MSEADYFPMYSNPTMSDFSQILKCFYFVFIHETNAGGLGLGFYSNGILKQENTVQGVISDCLIERPFRPERLWVRIVNRQSNEK